MKFALLLIIANLIYPEVRAQNPNSPGPTSRARSDAFNETGELTSDQKSEIQCTIDHLKKMGKMDQCDLYSPPPKSTTPQTVEVTVADCNCEPENPKSNSQTPTHSQSQPQPQTIPLAPDHPLRKKFNIDQVKLIIKKLPDAKDLTKKISSIEASASTTNDNHQGFLISPRFYLETYRTLTKSDQSYDGTPVMGLGDDSGNTYSIDANSKVVFVNGVKLNTSVGTRLYSRSADGFTTPGGKLKLIDDQTGEPIDFKGKLSDLNIETAQRSLSVTELKMEVVIPKNKMDYGLMIGSKTIDDTRKGTATRIQNGWHNTIGIYTFDNDAFENLVVDGIHRYLTLGASVTSPEWKKHFKKCDLTARAKAGFVANVPTSKNAFALNPVQPYAQGEMVVGMGKAKYNSQLKRYEFMGGVTIDPLNQTPEKRDMGTFGMADLGLRWNIPRDKNTTISIVPIHLYYPLTSGGSRKTDLMDQKPIQLDGRTIRQEDIVREIMADWFVVTYKKSFNHPKKK